MNITFAGSIPLFSLQDFGRFVSDYSLKPIADRLWQIYNNTEDFTNGVLMLVHQLTYQETIPVKYPIETLVAGKGDCDLFSLIAASILEAGGINTVLFYYKDQEHMNIGVALSQAPTQARTDPHFVSYQNTSYYVAECTGGNWREGWRVGECPDGYTNISTDVITLENMEQSSIGQVSASLQELDPSSLTLQVSPSFTLQNSELAIQGQIAPELANENVTLQAQVGSSTWTTIGTVQTQPDGRFSYSWNPENSGFISIQASWVGNQDYNGAASSNTNITVLPTLMIGVITAILLAVGIGSFAFFKTRQTPKRQERANIKPEIPQTSQKQAVITIYRVFRPENKNNK